MEFTLKLVVLRRRDSRNVDYSGLIGRNSRSSHAFWRNKKVQSNIATTRNTNKITDRLNAKETVNCDLVSHDYDCRIREMKSSFHSPFWILMCEFLVDKWDRSVLLDDNFSDLIKIIYRRILMMDLRFTQLLFRGWRRSV